MRTALIGASAWRGLGCLKLSPDRILLGAHLFDVHLGYRSHERAYFLKNGRRRQIKIGYSGAGMRTVAFCEIDEHCRAVLKEHWPDTPIHGDIRSLRGLPLSGLVSRREADRLGRRAERVGLCPDWIVVENVAHTWRRWVPELRRELWSLGYASVPFRVRASNVGAHHERARIFLVAHANGELLRKLSGWWHGPGREVAAQLAQSQDFAPARLGTDDGLPDWVDRRKALGNAVVPQIAELIGRGISAIQP